MHIISTRGSERATNDSGKIINFDRRIHVAWQDVTHAGYYNLARSFDLTSGQWSDPVVLDIGVDNHARAVLAIDNDGILHAILGGHGTQVHWTHALEPNSTAAWSDPVPLGVGTYPIFICGPDGTLYLTLRGNGKERHDRGVDLYRKPPGSEWSKPQRIVALGKEYGQAYAAYHMQMDIARDGSLHAIIDFYEGEDECGRGIHQATCYAQSSDQGRTWQRADGSPIRLPARPEDLDILARHTRSRHEKLPPPEIRQGGLVVNSSGQPYAFYMDHGEEAGHCRMVRLDANGALYQVAINEYWQRLYPDMRALECSAVLRADDALCLLVRLTPFNDEWQEGKPTRAMRMNQRDDQRLLWLLSTDGGEHFRIESCLEPGQSYNCPSVEKSVGINTIAAERLPYVLYFDGSQAYPGEGDYYDSSRSVSEILASGDFRTNNVILHGLDT